MTDKERLKKSVEVLKAYKNGDWILPSVLFSSIDTVIKQAERAQELEKRLKIYQRRSWFEDYEKVAKQNKRYREAMEKAKYESSHRIGDSGMIKIYEILSEALEGDCIHCNGKGFNGLDYCPQCNQMEEDDDN